MKRKLDENDVPVEVSEASPSFRDFGLDPRLLQAISRQKFATPTPVQVEAIPKALQGKDILARARTGSGKTAAYLLPLLQSILKAKASSKKQQSTSALILVPTRELANQVTKTVSFLSLYCTKEIQTVNLTSQIPDQAQRALLASNPDIVVATPARAAQHLASSTLNASSLTHLVIDEADLVLSYGYDDDFDNLVGLLPKGVQTFLASATLTIEVDKLRGLFCRDPVVLDLKDDENDSDTITQYMVESAEDEKFVLLFALFKLKLVKGKCIIFVGDVDRCYRVKLYLEQFGIKSCVLNSELPVNSRIHVVEEFNKNVYDIIIASDEHEVVGSDDQKSQKSADPTEESPEGQTNKKPKKDKKLSKKDKEYGVARGIDFQRVAWVLNFDLPPSSRSYTHRIGRTARAGHSGIALSFAVPASQYRKHKLLTHPCTARDPAVLATITADQAAARGAEHGVKPYHFDMAKLAGFRYRVESALKAVTPGAIREARIREVRQEMLKSEKLKRHLEENPEDLKWIRHDEEGNRQKRVQPHLRHVPEYLMPGTAGAAGEGVKGFVGIGRTGAGNRIREARKRNKIRAAKRGGAPAGKKKSDPLKTFNAMGRGK